MIDADTKAWIDARSGWLLNRFGWERVRMCRVVIPNAEFFPDPHVDIEAGARSILDRVCEFLAIDPRGVDLSLFHLNRLDEEDFSFNNDIRVAGTRIHLSLDASQFAKPMEMAATMAYELSRHELLRCGYVDQHSDDLEPLADLLTVFRGLGVITSNAALRDLNWQTDAWEDRQISRHSYCTMPMFGYALALFSQVRGEDSPGWAKYLRADVRHAFRKSSRYFSRAGLPDLRTVTTTQARPLLLIHDAKQRQDAQTASRNMDRDANCCGYCGSPLTNSPVKESVCPECQQSIDENQQALEAERQADALVSLSRRSKTRWGLLLMIAFLTAGVVLEWLGWIQ